MRNRHRFRMFLMVLSILMIFMVGCSNSQVDTNDTNKDKVQDGQSNLSSDESQTNILDSEMVTFIDSVGREVKLPTRITKVAASGSLAQMMIYSLAPDELVGWSRKLGPDQMKYFDERYTNLPVFGQFYGRNASLNLEALIEAKPDVIIDIGQIKSSIVEDMDSIEQQTGIPTIFIHAELNNYSNAYKMLGEVLGLEDEAALLAEYAQETLDAANEATNKMESDNIKKKTVVFGTGAEGLNCNAKGSVHAAVLDVVGVENGVVVDELSHSGGGNTISMEKLIEIDPDIIILSDKEAYSMAKKDSYWSALKAVKSGEVYFVPGEPYNFLASPPSINQLVGVKWLGHLVYPEYYQYDIKKDVQNYYKIFWHYDLSDEEVNDLLKDSMR